MKNSLQINSKYLDSDILLVSSILRTITHLVVIPAIITLSELHICSVAYIALICFMQVYRCKVLPTEENIFRKDTFFSIISFLVTSIFSVLVFFMLISLI